MLTDSENSEEDEFHDKTSSESDFFDQLDIHHSQLLVKRQRKYSIRVKVPRNVIQDKSDE